MSAKRPQSIGALMNSHPVRSAGLSIAVLLAAKSVLAAQVTDSIAVEISRAAVDTAQAWLTGQEWASIPVGGLAKELEIELYGSARTATPGGLLVIRYSLNSYEDQDERVRLRVLLPDGWTLLDREIDGRELLLESWENIEGEVRVALPADARPGDRHRVRLSGEVVGEPGSLEVYSVVQVVRRGGLRPGDVGLSGTTSVRATSFEVGDFGGARYGGSAQLSGRYGGTSLSLDYRQGPREDNLTNYRIAQEETRWSATLRGTGWSAQAGNQVSSYGNVLTGPSVRGRGIAFVRSQGRVVGDLTVAQPVSFLSGPSGHLLRGSMGVAGSFGRVSVTASDFGRPTGYSTAPIYSQSIDPDSLEKLERERRALEAASRNRVQGAGIDIELRPATAHRINLRGGLMRLHNAQGDTVESESMEAQYSFVHRRANLNARWRRMPESVPGIQLPGDEVSADGSVALIGTLRLTGRAYRTVNHTVGDGYQSDGNGAAVGVRMYSGGWHFDARRNHREWSYGAQPVVARTFTIAAGAPVGPVALNLFADVGEQNDGTARRPVASYRSDLRWSGRSGMASLSTGYYESLNAPPRLRADLLGSVHRGDWELAGGAWATHGLTVGGEPGVWAQVGVPVTYDLLFMVGVERSPPTWGMPPAWLGTLGIRKKVAFALPFLRDRSPLPMAPPMEPDGGSP